MFVMFGQSWFLTDDIHWVTFFTYTRYVSYWGRFSGVGEGALNAKTSIRDVQAVLLNLFSADPVLIGHSFEHSLLCS